MVRVSGEAIEERQESMHYVLLALAPNLLGRKQRVHVIDHDWETKKH